MCTFTNAEELGGFVTQECSRPAHKRTNSSPVAGLLQREHVPGRKSGEEMRAPATTLNRSNYTIPGLGRGPKQVKILQHEHALVTVNPGIAR